MEHLPSGQSHCKLSPTCKESTPGKAEGGKTGRNVKGSFFAEMGFLPRGLNLSTSAGFKPFD